MSHLAALEGKTNLNWIGFRLEFGFGPIRLRFGFAFGPQRTQQPITARDHQAKRLTNGHLNGKLQNNKSDGRRQAHPFLDQQQELKYE